MSPVSSLISLLARDSEDDTLTPSIEAGNDAGAAGDSSSSINFSTGALVAVVIVVVVVILFGVSTASLFFIAKKREWTIRETIRRSTRKVANALTPRRAEFPREVKDGMGARRGRTRINEVPPTPRLRPEDLEKGLAAAKKPSDRKPGQSKTWLSSGETR